MSGAIHEPNLLELPDPREPLNNSWEGSFLARFLAQDSGRTAIEEPEEVWSYGDLDQASADLARYLCERGSDKKGVIAVYAARRATLVVALLGIIRSGNAFVILDPSYPLVRNLQCVGLARPTGFINLLPNEIPHELLQGKFLVNLPARKPELLLRSLSASGQADSEVRSACPDELLYVAFTSGSTGIPKAILGTHRPVLHFFAWQQQHFGLNESHRVSMLSGLSHDPLLRDTLMPLFIGATICVPPQGCYEVPNRLFEWMGDASISLCHLTPSLGGLLLGSSKKSASPALESLQYAFFGGEALRYPLVRKIKEFAPNVTVVNCYGATETPQVMGFHAVTVEEINGLQPEESEGTLVPIGRGIADAQLLVLDEDFRLCRPKTEGQICIRSPFLAKEVLDSKGAPIEIFEPNPYGSDLSDKIYPTGDYGFYRADGSVVYLGRRDKQVKILGHRVQLEEIETAIAGESAIRNYQLVPESDEFGNTILILYVVPEQQGKLDQQRLRERLKASLPDFMVPQRIVQLRELPLTPNGKVDLVRLKQAGSPGEAGKNRDAGPPAFDSTGAGLLRIFSRATSHPALRPEDNLLEAGLNSLQAITACCAIEEEFGVTLSVQDLVECGNVVGIAARLKGDTAGVIPQKAPVTSSVSRLAASSNGHIPATGHEPHVRLLPRHENLFVGTKNRVLQLLARIAPDYWRAKLHKLRGVQIGQDVSIGYDTIVETAYPWLVRIGSHANIGMRVTILAHFRGMAGMEKGSYSVDIRDYVFVGPHVVILPNVTIGEGAVITAGSVVNTDIPALVLAHGNPAVPIARCGVALAGETQYADFLRKLKPL